MVDVTITTKTKQNKTTTAKTFDNSGNKILNLSGGARTFRVLWKTFLSSFFFCSSFFLFLVTDTTSLFLDLVVSSFLGVDGEFQGSSLFDPFSAMFGVRWEGLLF